jgi:hypothetical protein
MTLSVAFETAVARRPIAGFIYPSTREQRPGAAGRLRFPESIINADSWQISDIQATPKRSTSPASRWLADRRNFTARPPFVADGTSQIRIDYQHSQWKDHRRADYRSRPHGRGRVIDVSRAAARELDMIDSGTILVSIECQ